MGNAILSKGEWPTILDKIIISKPRAPRILIYGKNGIGKTTLASCFPDPLFLLTEDFGINNLNCLPVAQDYKEVIDNLTHLYKLEELPFKTLIIDSISALDLLIVKHILEEEREERLSTGQNKNNPTLATSCGGYGAGYQRAQALHKRIFNGCEKLNSRGISIIFIAHLDTVRFKAPEGHEYDTHSIVMNHDKSRHVYIDGVDAVLFGKLKSFVVKNENKREHVKSTDHRILVCGANDAHVSKNRFGMPSEIEMSFDEIKKYIPYYNTIN